MRMMLKNLIKHWVFLKNDFLAIYNPNPNPNPNTNPNPKPNPNPNPTVSLIISLRTVHVYVN